ncbi:hypothetical protein NRK67_13495 [Fusobacteria bacterium ZRK30]|nr:hypothetical protein NRK67_13495 [Fusobacteria bacterium ZRK30]
MDIDLINRLKYQILKKYKDQEGVNELIYILENLEKKINNLEKKQIVKNNT